MTATAMTAINHDSDGHRIDNDSHKMMAINRYNDGHRIDNEAHKNDGHKP